MHVRFVFHSKGKKVTELLIADFFTLLTRGHNSMSHAKCLRQRLHTIRLCLNFWTLCFRLGSRRVVKIFTLVASGKTIAIIILTAQLGFLRLAALASSTKCAIISGL